MSCKGGKYLQINKTLDFTGNCVNKTDAPVKDVQILVTNKDGKGKVSGDYMTDNIMDAIFKAFKYTTNFTH